MSKHLVVSSWEKGKVRKIRSCTIKADEQALYSYGSHFPLVVRNPSGLMIGNGDRYGVTTSRHQGEVRHLVQVLVPFTGLSGLSIDPFRDWIEMVEKQNDFYREVTTTRMNRKTGKMEPFTYSRHFLGGSLIRVYAMIDGKKSEASRSIVCGWDTTGSGYNGVFFMSEIAVRAKTFDEAIKSLKPDAVKKWEEQHHQDAMRQGEWFFLPVDGLPNGCTPTHHSIVMPQLKRVDGQLQRYPVLSGNRGTGHHTAPEIMIGPDGKQQYVRGMVRHQTSEHKVVRLGKVWHLAVENTAIASYGMGGNVD